MENRKKILAGFATVLAGILLVSMASQSMFAGSMNSLFLSPQSPISKGTPTPIPGNVYTGMYIRIGVNWGGTFGVGNGTDGFGVGFQYPIGNQFESLAIWWWGEGYVIFYKTLSPTGVWVDNKAYWWPSLGWPPPPFCRMVHVAHGQYMNDDNRAVFWSTMKTIDGALTLTFAFSFPKHQKYVLLQTVIKNNLGAKLRDVLYKRIVDWDIHQEILNHWTSDAHAAYASLFSTRENRWIELSVAGYTNPTLYPHLVSYVDLWAWDDIDAWGNSTTTRDPGKMDIQSHDKPLLFDGNAALYYDLWDLNPYETRNVWTVYQAGWNAEIAG